MSETNDEIDPQKVCSTEYRGIVLKIIAKKLDRSSIESLKNV